MEIGTCNDCKYWQPPVNKMGECLKTVSGWRVGIGSYNNNGDWEGGFYCGPDFGCIHWAHKGNKVRFNSRGQSED